MKKGVLIVSVLLAVLVVGGIYFFLQNSSNNQTSNQATGTINNSNQIAVGEPNPTADETSSDASTPKSYDIEISGYSFLPSTLTINVGDDVTWTNMDSAPHTVTSDSGSELNSGTLSGESSGGYYSSPTSGGTYSHTFSSAGTYAYHCNLHASMKGTIVVE